MYRIVTISGLSFTGTTTLASELAKSLGWTFLSAGERFRQYCNTKGLSLTSIPNDVHLAFDATIKEEIRMLEHVVMEGRYLGFFAKDYNDVLTVWVHSKLASRSARCLEREDVISSLEEAGNHIVDRDSCEKGIGNELYGLADFTNPAQFARVFENSDEDDREKIISALTSVVIPGTQASE
ncbi:MAG TPA: hypothetical protein VKC61_16165 [Pyrinomonadaceae bacterium]|nr:hypothetical protein [Pyrinomonadaceae bacterium]